MKDCHERLSMYRFTLQKPHSSKAKLQKEGIFFLIHLFARKFLLMKMLEIEETNTS